MARFLAACTYFLLLSIVWSAGGVDATAQPQRSEDAASETTELIVRLEANAPSSLRQALETPAAARPAAVAPLFAQVQSTRPAFPERRAEQQTGTDRWPVYLVSVTDASALASVQQTWADQPGVRYVEPNDFFELDILREHAALPDDLPISLDPDTIDAQLDHLDVIRAREAHTITRGDPSVTMGVIDSGIFYTHPDLENQMWVNRPEDVANAGTFVPANRQGTDEDGNGWVDDVIGYSFVDRPEFPEAGRYGPRAPDPRPDSLRDPGRHGTTVAGVLGAQEDNNSGMKGVAPEARIAALRAFGGDGRGRTRDIAAAVIYGADMGMDVLNMSFGRDRSSPLLHEAIRYAHEQGTVLVASAGNTAGDAPHYPSDYPEVISSIWLAEDGEGLPAFSTSSYGIGADIGAPGTNVFTTDYPRSLPENEITPADLYVNSSGSSFSAPQVTGAVALLRSLDSDLSPADIRSILTSTTADVGLPGWDNRTAAGRLDVYEALKRALPGDTQITSPEHNSGWDTNQIAVIGNSVHPKHASFEVKYARGTSNVDDATWTTIQEPVSERVLNDTLATWSVSNLEEGSYTLRLITNLTDGRTVEDRRRVRIQRTSPTLTIHAMEPGLVGSAFGIIADVESNQRTRITLDVTRNGDSDAVQSEFQRRRHGVSWADTRGTGGAAAVRLIATNDAGLETAFDTTLTIPERRFQSQLLERNATSVPRGHLLPQLVDFDEDTLPELLLNPLTRQGGISDSLYLYEWTGADFVRGDSLRANVFPRDVGDTNASGTPELLTQVASATLLLEQGPGEWLPKTQAFIDTTGSADSPFIGSRLVDLQERGSSQIVGHTRSVWEGLRYDGSSYVPAFGIGPRDVFLTPDTLDLQSIIGPAIAATGDYTGNGRANLLVGDQYGQLILYETLPNRDKPLPIWSHASNRFGAGQRFGTGDITGDGVDNFITFTQHYPLTLPNSTRMPPRSTYTVWERDGPDDFTPAYRLPVAGDPGATGSITTANLTGDDRDEVIIAHTPYLIVLRNHASRGWEVAYIDDRAGGESVVSPAMVAGDVSGNGQPDVFVATRQDHLVRYTVQDNALAVPPPQWREATALAADEVRLRWDAPGADSVGVFQRLDGDAFTLRTAQQDSSLSIATSEPAAYALRAWSDGTASPLSPPRRIVPHAPATVTDVSYPASNQVRLQFDTQMSEATRAEQFTYEGATARRVIGAANYEALVVTLPPDVPRTGTLTWSDVRDALDLPVGQTEQNITLPERSDAPFFLTEWDRSARQQVTLHFNDAVDAERASDIAGYRVTPPGDVTAARVAPDDPMQVELDIGGVAIGGTGSIITLQMDDLISADGRTLAPESRAVQLTGPAEDLDDVYVYPNPMRAADHDPHVTIAELPTEATLRIISVDGRRVRTLHTDRAAEGGLEWDLQDESGQRVPTGVYYIRVESPGESPVMVKAAVIW